MAIVNIPKFSHHATACIKTSNHNFKPNAKTPKTSTGKIVFSFYYEYGSFTSAACNLPINLHLYRSHNKDSSVSITSVRLTGSYSSEHRYSRSPAEKVQQEDGNRFRPTKLKIPVDELEQMSLTVVIKLIV